MWAIYFNWFYNSLKALESARSNAENARHNAQEAQEKFAEQASKVNTVYKKF